MNVNNRWFQLGAGLITMIMIANFQYAWTLFVVPIQQANGWKLSDVQWAFTLFILAQTWAQPASGWLIDRLGPRIFYTLAGLMCGIGWGGLGYVTSLPMLYALYGLGAGVGAAIVYGGSVGSALKWFRDKRGLAVGIMTGGFGGGAALFIPVISRIIATHGYRTAFIWTGLFQGLVIVVTAQFLRHPPAAGAPAPGAVAARTGSHAPANKMGDHDFATGEMVRTPTFYWLYLMFVMMATGGLVLTAQAGPVARSWGISGGALTLAVSLGPIANLTSRVGFGAISDRIGRELAMGIGFALNALALVLVLVAGRISDGWFVVTLVLIYVTWGEMYSLFPATLGDYFGPRYGTSNYGVLYTAKGVASIIGGGIAAMLFESFGTWSAAFAGSAVMALIASIMAFGLRSVMAARAVKPIGAMSPLPAK